MKHGGGIRRHLPWQPAMRPATRDSQAVSEKAVSLHVLPTAATMIGVCMTVISIVKLTPPGPLRHFADRLLGIDGTLFMTSVVFAYCALRSRRHARALERWADFAFLAGLAMMSVVGMIVAFEFL
jgi:hypothetical protein